MTQSATIDDIDLKILDKLEADARIDLKDIAKACSLTSSAILKRIEKLKTSKVIVGTGLVLKRGIFGYTSEATVAITAENSQVDQIAQKVRAIPNVMVCAKSIGRYNLYSHIFARNLFELDNVTHKIKGITGIKAISTNIHIDDDAFDPNGNALYNSKNPLKLDETDLKILDELIKDSQTPFTKIAKTLSVSHETVRQRFEKLRKEGLIKKCTIVIDRSKIGYQGTGFFLISCSENQSVPSTMNALRGLQLFSTIDRIVGSTFDIFAGANVKDLKNLATITAKLEKIPEIENVEVAFLLFTYYSFIPKPLAPYSCDSIELS